MRTTPKEFSWCRGPSTGTKCIRQIYNEWNPTIRHKSTDATYASSSLLSSLAEIRQMPYQNRVLRNLTGLVVADALEPPRDHRRSDNTLKGPEEDHEERGTTGLSSSSHGPVGLSQTW
ncbi:hypothetical protein FRB94_014714 [Tulasnella sp. JGI-2019a]|nr:hypothetical protein FRB94_014714 [Tulasnella sp. JGI-2019a]